MTFAERLMMTCVLSYHLASVAGFTGATVGSRRMIPNPGTACTPRHMLVGRRGYLPSGSRPMVTSHRWTKRLQMSKASPEDVAGKPTETVTLTLDGLKTKNNMNSFRKIFHAISGVGLALAYELLLTRLQATVLFGLSFVVLTAVEVMRLRFPQNEVSKLLFGQFRKIARDYETNQVEASLRSMPAPYLNEQADPQTDLGTRACVGDSTPQLPPCLFQPV